MKRQLPSELLWLCPYYIDNLQRIGRDHDGGYIVPQSMVDNSDSLLSLGLGDDWSFEQSWLAVKPDSPIHLYDGDPIGDGWNNHLNDQFTEFVKPPSTYFKEHITSTNFDSALDKLGQNIFIKMDIEGGEYNIIKNILNNSYRIIGITLEIHDCNGERARFVETVQNIQKLYKIVHLHGNTYSGDTYFDRPMLLTDALELTFVRNDFCKSNEFRKQIFIQALDNSNCPNFEDIEYFFN